MKGSRSLKFSPTHGLLGNRAYFWLNWALVHSSGMQMFCIARGSGNKRFDLMYSAFTTSDDGSQSKRRSRCLYVPGDTQRWKDSEFMKSQVPKVADVSIKTI